MLDQTFSIENLHKIYYNENRKGNDLSRRFFPDIHNINEKLVKGSYKDKETYLERKRIALRNHLTNIYNEIHENDFKLQVNINTDNRGRPIYTVTEDPVSYFIVKQVQENISHLYKVKQSNRNFIIRQLTHHLENRIHKSLIKTDIISFYENIKGEILLEKFRIDGLLSTQSLRILAFLIENYQNNQNTNRGIPRGLSVSAVLSELYMRKFDNYVLNKGNILYYARYVDDIVVLLLSNSLDEADNLKEEMKEELSKINLRLSRRKSKTIHDFNKNSDFSYLGYMFTLDGGKVQLNMTPKRLKNIKNKIKKSFNAYLKSSIRNKGYARKILINRIRYLTGNTRLLNNKRNVLIGIYSDNKYLTGSMDLQKLDNSLNWYIRQVPDSKLRYRLKKLTFTRGFDFKIFRNFNCEELEKITKVWK